MQGYYLRVYLEDGSYHTVPVSINTSATEVVKRLLKKRSHMDHAQPSLYSLYVAQAVNNDEFERRLEPDESPLALQETVRTQGHLHHFRFHLRRDSKSGLEEPNTPSTPTQTNQQHPPPRKRLQKPNGDGDSSSGEGKSRGGWVASPRFKEKRESNSVFGGKRGYLDKKGPRDKAFRNRYFVVQQGKLFYFADHQDYPLKPISSIDLRHALVKGVEGSMQFEIVLQTKVYQLRAESSGDVSEWVRLVREYSHIYIENNEVSACDSILENTEEKLAEHDIEAMRNLLDLKNALENERCLELISSYLKKTHCHENLEFYLAVCDFEKRFAVRPKNKNNNSSGLSYYFNHLQRITQIFSSPNNVDDVQDPDGKRERIRSVVSHGDKDESISEAALRIYNTYLEPNAPRMISVSRKECRKIKQAISDQTFLQVPPRSPRAARKGKKGLFSSWNSSVSVGEEDGVCDDEKTAATTNPLSSSSTGVRTCFSRVKNGILASLKTQQFHSLARTPEYLSCMLALDTPYELPFEPPKAAAETETETIGIETESEARVAPHPQENSSSSGRIMHKEAKSGSA